MNGHRALSFLLLLLFLLLDRQPYPRRGRRESLYFLLLYDDGVTARECYNCTSARKLYEGKDLGSGCESPGVTLQSAVQQLLAIHKNHTNDLEHASSEHFKASITPRVVV